MQIKMSRYAAIRTMQTVHTMTNLSLVIVRKR
jgi:hypothetical protein